MHADLSVHVEAESGIKVARNVVRMGSLCSMKDCGAANNVPDACLKVSRSVPNRRPHCKDTPLSLHYIHYLTRLMSTYCDRINDSNSCEVTDSNGLHLYLEVFSSTPGLCTEIAMSAKRTLKVLIAVLEV